MPKPSPGTQSKGTCLVLGGSGFLGAHLVTALAAAGYRVRSFDRRAPLLPFTGAVETIVGDFQNAGEVADAVAGCELCFHLASTTIPKSSNDDPVFDVESNIAGTLRLLDSCRRQGVRKFIYASSGGTVYGVPQYTPIDEKHPTEPVCSYGIVKLAVEKYLHLYHTLYGIDYRVLRVSNPYGPGQNVHAAQGAVGVFLGKVFHDEAIHVWGDGSVVRDYLYVGDVTRAFLAAIEHAGTERVINIGSGHGLDLNTLLREIGQATGRQPRVTYEAARPFDVPVSVLDIRLAREGLNWKPEIAIDEGLRRTWRWLLAREPQSQTGHN